MSEFLMPSLGADMEAGTLIEWLKRPGDAVKRGDVIAVVETQKGAIEIEVFETGILDRQLVPPGTTVPVGTPMAVIRAPGAQPAPAAPSPAGPVAAPPVMPPAAIAVPGPVAPRIQAPAGERPLASPAARRLAAARGIAIAGLRGTGPGGAVITDDVPSAPRPAARPAEAGRKPGLDLAEMRKAIAAAMARSKRDIPHYYLSTAIDLGTASAWLGRVNAARPPAERLLLGSLLVKAAALALRHAPAFNGFFRESGFQPSAAIHIGLAVALRGGGLIAPALHDADRLDLPTLMAAMRDLVERCRSGRLRGSEMTDPTITLTSLGERGIDSVMGVIFPPQVAILGFGRPAERPWVVAGRIEARQVVQASLAADHRVSDGHAGARLLAEIDRLLQEPDRL
jgi:pyruvate dehydrogenase E2 component (dihydrolipoamide acetyltransferase)